MKVGLFFGSFNPIHIGHLVIANHLVEYSDLDQVWFVVTPHNPFKNKNTLLDNYQRLEMVYRATKDYTKLKPSDIEFNLPQPNYTINTLVHLQEKYPIHIEDENVIVNAGILPNEQLCRRIAELKPSETLLLDGELVAARLNEVQFEHLIEDEQTT